ncbi:protein lethal(2)k10201 [Ceratitis capitata]|uniref:protein lethal(2)k10201 n=1 Tax=Ceratitis capitata TaxID=7213 RepID=UPI00032A20AB|nr:protein lethal(2)k10201 [Ceratitis capitata]
MLSIAELIELLNNIPFGYKSPDDICFSAANEMYIPKYKKLGVIAVANEPQEEPVATNPISFFCNIPGCTLDFEDISSYQAHFKIVHRFICSICRRYLPTAYLLELHISERHDSYFAIRVERGEAMYSCFLQECKQKMLTPQARKEHCINAHKFLANYRFEQLCGRSSKTSSEMSEAMDIPLDSPNVNMEFSFGHAKGSDQTP